MILIFANYRHHTRYQRLLNSGSMIFKVCFSMTKIESDYSSFFLIHYLCNIKFFMLLFMLPFMLQFIQVITIEKLIRNSANLCQD